MNKLELMNELSICLLSYLCFSFTDYQLDVRGKINAGWAYCLIIILNFFFNICFMAFMSIKNLCKPKKPSLRSRRRRKITTNCTDLSTT